MADIKTAGLTKYFGDALGVENVNLTVSDGELFVLTGPAGSGKSTLVRLLAGVEEPSEGDIWLGGQPVNDLPAKDRQVALLFQNYALTPDASVFDNIAIPLKLQQTPPDETQQRVREVAEMLGIGSLLERAAGGLAVTQSYHVALARAFASQPRVLLMDGALGSLEPEVRAEALAQLTQWQRELGITTVYTAQDQAEAMHIAQRLAVLRAGRIQQVGTPAELYERPANRFVAGFIGRPQMNLLQATVAVQDEKMYLDIGPMNVEVRDELTGALAAYEGQPVVLGIRPEDIFDQRAAPPKPTITPKSMRVQVEEVTGVDGRHLLLLNAGQDILTAIASLSSVPPVGSSIEIVLDFARLHLFDEDTGNRIA